MAATASMLSKSSEPKKSFGSSENPNEKATHFFIYLLVFKIFTKVNWVNGKDDPQVKSFFLLKTNEAIAES